LSLIHTLSYIDKMSDIIIDAPHTPPPFISLRKLDVQTFRYNPLSFLIFVMPGQTVREMMVVEDIGTRTGNDGAAYTTSILGMVGSDVAEEMGDNPLREKARLYESLPALVTKDVLQTLMYAIRKARVFLRCVSSATLESANKRTL
jgi:hypothetical protein